MWYLMMFERFSSNIKSKLLVALFLDLDLSRVLLHPGMLFISLVVMLAFWCAFAIFFPKNLVFPDKFLHFFDKLNLGKEMQDLWKISTVVIMLRSVRRIFLFVLIFVLKLVVKLFCSKSPKVKASHRSISRSRSRSAPRSRSGSKPRSLSRYDVYLISSCPYIIFFFLDLSIYIFFN